MIKKIIKFIVGLFIIFIILFFLYLSIGQNKVYESDVTYMAENSNYKNGYYELDRNSDTGLIFYSGAKVDPRSYSYLKDIKDVNIYLPKFPFNFAFFKPNVAQKIIDENQNIDNWYIGGHSLGGVFASNFAVNNADIIDGIIFLGSYPAAKMENHNMKCLLIYGTKDTVVGDYTTKKDLFNQNTEVVKIKGGNHTQFGNYDLQKGDSKSDISSKEQHKIITDSITDFIK